LGGEPRGGLFEASSLARAAEGAEVVIHAATAIPVSSKPAPKDWEMNNRIRVEGTRALAEATARAGAKMLVLQSITWIARPADGSAFDEDSPFNSDPSIRTTADMEMIAGDAGARSGFRTAILRCGWFHAPDAGIHAPSESNLRHESCRSSFPKAAKATRCGRSFMRMMRARSSWPPRRDAAACGT